MYFFNSFNIQMIKHFLKLKFEDDYLQWNSWTCNPNVVDDNLGYDAE